MGGARRDWEALLKVEDWKSDYTGVDRLLRHLGRKTSPELTVDIQI